MLVDHDDVGRGLDRRRRRRRRGGGRVGATGATIGWPSTVTRSAGRVTSAVTPPDGDEVSFTATAKRAARRPMTMKPSERLRARPTSGGRASWVLASAS